MVMDYTPKPGQPPELQPAKCRRIEIPVEPYDELLMRDLAEVLRALAYKLEFWAKLDRDTREKRIMSIAEIDHLNSQIRHLSETKGYRWRAGRPTNKELKSRVMDQGEAPSRLHLPRPSNGIGPDDAKP